MVPLPLTLLVITIVVIAIQSYFVLRVTIDLLRSRSDRDTDATLPKASVLLAVRGVDPYIKDTINGLLDQDYPDYDIHVVVDNRLDPVWQTLQQLATADETNRLKVSELQTRRETCSLKGSALIQCFEQVDDNCEIVAFLDSDILPNRSWLREMALPLQDNRVGATTGNRWYAPPGKCWGSLVRYFWNASALVQMWLIRMVWGGCMAMRKDVVYETNILEKWSQSLSTDAIVYRQLRENGYDVELVLSQIMVNREEISLTNFVNWSQRQLLTTRLYHPGWFSVVFQAVVITVLQVATIGAFVFGIAYGDERGIVRSLCALAIYWIGSLLLTGILEWSVRRTFTQDQPPMRWLRLATVIKLPLAIALIHVVHPITVVYAMLRRRICWRGISYDIAGPWKVRMVNYRPHASSRHATQNVSVT